MRCDIMTVYDFKTIVQKARYIKHSVESTYDYTVTSRWCYYICKAILEPGKSFSGFKIAEANNPRGTYISRTVSKADYLDMCRRVVKYVELKKKMPNHVAYRTEYKINIRLFTYIAAYLLVHYVDDRMLKDKVNINSKYFVKPTEPTNEVYAYFVKVFGNITCIDDALDKIDGNGYGYYYDDQYTNRQSIDRMKNHQGVNCTDSCHVFYNLGLQFVKQGKYKKVECLHVMCRGGDGHVRLRFTLPNGETFYRDPACTLSDGGYCNWCMDGEVIAINPKWFMDNLSR